MARELLTPSGSVFVQISDENLHHVRELMDEVFGAENFCSLVTFQKKTMPLGSEHFEQVADYLLWYASSRENAKTRPVFERKRVESDPLWSWAELDTGERRRMTSEEVDNHRLLPPGARVYRLVSMLPAQYRPNQDFPFDFDGVVYHPPGRSCWKTDREGMEGLVRSRRLQPAGQTLQYVLFLDDYPYSRKTALWSDTGGASEQDLHRPNLNNDCAALHDGLHRPRRSRVGSHLRQRHNRLCCRAMGTPLDHDRHEPGPDGACPPATADGDLRLLRTQGAVARAGRRLRLQAQAEQEGRGSRRHRAACHAQEHRQRRAAG